MGTYIGMGIVHKIVVSKNEMDEIEFDLEQLKENINQKFYFDMELYDVHEVDNYYIFLLKGNVIEKDLKGFLEEIYPSLYRDDEEDYNEVLKKLENLKADEIIEYSKTKPLALQYDKYCYSDYLYGIFGRSVKLSYEAMTISSEGKVMVETFGNHANFFKATIIKAYPKYKITGAFKIYVTG